LSVEYYSCRWDEVNCEVVRTKETKDSDYNLVENAFVYEYRMLARDITIKVDFEPDGHG